MKRIALIVCLFALPLRAESFIPSTYLGPKVRTCGNGGQYAATYAGLQAALTASASGDTVQILANTAVPGSLSGSLNVPSGVTIRGFGPTTSTIVMPAGTPTEATVRFLGSNYIEGVGIYHQTSSTGGEGGICLCGNGHTFVNCYMDGNQDCVTLGHCVANSTTPDIATSAFTTMTITGTTLTKTGAFANYTWVSGDTVDIVAGGTTGIYTIASKTDSDNVVLGSAPGNSAGGASAFVNSQYSQWYGGTRLVNCKCTNWNFDFWRINAEAPDGQQDIRCVDSDFVATSAAQAWMRDSVYSVVCDNCFIDGTLCQSGGFNILGRLAGIIYRSAQNDAATVTALALSAATVSSATITQTGKFATYTFRPGDTLVIASGTGATAGTYYISSRTNADTIVLTTAPGGSGTDIVAALNPVYRFNFNGGVIRHYTAAGTQGLFRISNSVATAARSGISVNLSGVWFDTLPTTLLFKGAAHATVTPKSNAVLTNCRLPEAWVQSSALSAINGTNNPTVRLRGSSLQDTNKAVTDAATVTLDPNLAATFSWTCTQNTSLVVTALSGTYYTGQRIKLIVGDAGAHTLTPDGSTILGAALTTVAGKTIIATYVYNGTAYIQDAVQTTGY